VIAAALCLCVAACLSLSGCGSGPGDHRSRDSSGPVVLVAGGTMGVSVPIPAESTGDSVTRSGEADTHLHLVLRGRGITLTAFLAPGSGASAEDRLRYLVDSMSTSTSMTTTSSSSDSASVSLRTEPPLGDLPGFTAVLARRDGRSVVERVWALGSGELLVLEASCEGETPGILLEIVGMTLREAAAVTLGGDERGVRLSDRSRTDIVAEVNADVTPPPELTHRLRVSVDPSDRITSVTDTLTVDFGTTPSDSSITFVLPAGCSSWDIQAVRGSLTVLGDSVACAADSGRVFAGVYSGTWDGFYSDSPDSIAGGGLQIRPTCSFQCGMWFHPGCDIPADYALAIEVPAGGASVYVPLPEVSRVRTDSLLLVTYASEGAGLRGPLAWATGGFSSHRIAGGRSEFLSYEADTLSAPAMEAADLLATSIWSSLGFEGARLDFVVVRSLDVPVLLVGPGCVFASPEILLSLSDPGSWADSLAAGVPVRATAVADGAARALLTESTWLTGSLRTVLSAWAVYRYAADASWDGGDPLLLEAFLKYYLFQTRTAGGTEYALADPLLDASPLAAPVLTGKGPLVVEFLDREVPGFGPALRRALGSLRHSGDSYGRILSQMGLAADDPLALLYERWLYSPGVPVLRVTWDVSGETLRLHAEQLQPGAGFPLGSTLDEVTVLTPSGPIEVSTTAGPPPWTCTATLPGLPSGATGIDIDPERILPADVVYRRSDVP